MNKMLGDVDSEAVRLTKQFRTVPGSAPGNPNKYEAIANWIAFGYAEQYRRSYFHLKH